VTGIAGSGKTTLLCLLHAFILEKRSNARVFVLDGWTRSKLEHFRLRERWAKMIKGWDGYRKNDFYLIDEGHTSYWDEALWKAFKDDFQRSSVADAPHVVLFCSYSEDLRELHTMIPPVVGEKLTLARITEPPNGTRDGTPVGLLLDWKEYEGVLDRFADKKLLLDDELKAFIFEFTAGHVGAVRAMFAYMTKMVRCLISYHMLLLTPKEEPTMTNGAVTFAEFQSKDLIFQKLTAHLIKDSIVSRSLSNDPDYYPAMKRLLLDSPVRHHDKDEDLFVKASKRGLIERTDNLFYDFPTPLHRHIWSWKLMPSKQYNYPGDIFALIKDTMAGFRPNQLSRSSRRPEMDVQDPPEVQYWHEWYRSLHKVIVGNVVVSPEYATVPGKRRGRVDFLIPSMKWGVEIIRDESELRGHSDLFLTGAYSALMSGEIVDYALLHFSHSIPLVPTPG
jgi:hypothetical protein